jgi:hypothetical protein
VAVHAEDLIAGKIVCQLHLVPADTVRSALRMLAGAEDGPSSSLLAVLLSRKALTPDGHARAQRYTRLYQAVRAAALETAILKNQGAAPDELVDRALAEVERGGFARRVSEMLVVLGELGRAQAQRITEHVGDTLAAEDKRLVTSYTSADYEGVARSITKDRNALLDTGQFTVKKLFRSKESQRLARMSPMGPTGVRATQEIPVAPASLVDMPNARFTESRATPVPDGERTMTEGIVAPVTSPAGSVDEQTNELAFNRIGPYLKLRKLGDGPLGTVFLARRSDLAKPVALKIAKPERKAEAAARFKRAAERARDVRNESLAHVIDMAEYDGTPVLAVEYVTGESMRVVLDREGPFGEVRAVAYATSLLGGLVAVHAAGFVHGALVPDSIILTTQSGRPHAKLSDLGLAVRSDERQPKLLEPAASYVSPEALVGNPVDGRSDLYSLGLVLFEMLTGTFPFGRASPDELRDQKLGVAPSTLMKARPDRTFSPVIEELVARFLARDPKHRPPQAARAARAIAEIVLPGLGDQRDTARLGMKFDAVFKP